MSVVVFGQRPYGQVDSHGGEHAETVFFHIQFMPLIPISSQWITSEPGEATKTGFPIKLHLRSVAAAYLRWWGLVGGVIAMCTGSAAGGIAGAALLLASVASWWWTWRIGSHAQRRSDLDRIAFGHRCDPALLTDEDRARIARKLSDRLARGAEPRPPDDVARFGARDFDEAITAYGLLRLNSQRGEARAAARQLMSYAFEKLPSDGGPFRAAGAAAAPDAAVAIAEAIHTEIAAEAGRRKQRIARLPKRWFHRPTVQLIGLALASLMVIPATIAEFTPAHRLTARQLDGADPIYGRVSVTCDAPPEPYGVGSKAVSMCAVGKHLLPIVHAAAPPLVAITDTTLYGSLRLSLGYDRHHDSLIQHIAQDPDVAGRTYDFVFEQESAGAYWIGALGLALFNASLAFGWAVWIRARLRRRAAKRASA